MTLGIPGHLSDACQTPPEHETANLRRTRQSRDKDSKLRKALLQ